MDDTIVEEAMYRKCIFPSVIKHKERHKKKQEEEFDDVKTSQSSQATNQSRFLLSGNNSNRVQTIDEPVATITSTSVDIDNQLSKEIAAALMLDSEYSNGSDNDSDGTSNGNDSGNDLGGDSEDIEFGTIEPVEKKNWALVLQDGAYGQVNALLNVLLGRATYN